MPTSARSYKPNKGKRPTEDNRPSASHRGYDSKWNKLRNHYITRNPLCVMCRAKGRIRAAEIVDHITPIMDGGARLDEANLQSLCRECHGEKTSEDIKRRVVRKR